MAVDRNDLWEDFRSGSVEADDSSWSALADAPRTKEDLHDFILERIGIDVPQVAVCEGHSAPMDAIWAVYSGEARSVIWLANRGGGKTLYAAVCHFLRAVFEPGSEGVSVGAIEQQAIRAYRHLLDLLKRDGGFARAEDHPLVESSVRRETRFVNGSEVGVIIGTVQGVNGPHPQLTHMDEIDVIQDRRVWTESRHMTQSKGSIPGVDLVTSTRKSPVWLMQELLDEVKQAEHEGHEPPHVVFSWCVFEAAENVPNCGNGCGCEKVVKGSWDDGSPRSFESVCRGRLKRAGGWMPLEDVQQKFVKTDRDSWEAQEECLRPSTEGLVLSRFRRDRQCVRWYEPDPANGQIFTSTDFGATNPSGTLWLQILDRDVLVHDIHQTQSEEPRKLMKRGSVVVFDELYRAEVGDNQLHDMIREREAEWRRRFLDFPSSDYVRRFYDEQGRGAVLNWQKRGFLMVRVTGKSTQRDINALVELVDDDMLFISLPRVEMLPLEIQGWRWKPGRQTFFDFPNHSLDALRYGVANLIGSNLIAPGTGAPPEPQIVFLPK